MHIQLQNIYKLLSNIRLHQKIIWISSTLIGLIPVLASILFIAAVVESIAWFDTSVRQPVFNLFSGVSALIILASIVSVIILLVRRNYPANEKLARIIWSRDQKVRDKIIDALDLADSTDKYSSQSLKLEAIRRIDEQAVQLDKDDYLHRRWLKKSLRFSGVVLIVYVFAGFIAGKSLIEAGDRLIHPTREYLKPGTVIISMDMADSVSIVQGDSLELKAETKHHNPEYVRFFMDEGAGSINEVNGVPLPGNPSKFSASIEDIKRSFDVFAKGDKYFSDTIHVNVIPRPRIARLEVQVKPPGYTGMAVQHLPEGVGDIAALPGSRIRVKLESNRQLNEAKIFLGKEDSPRDSINLSVVNRTASGSFLVSGNGSWWVNFTATDGVQSDDPLLWKINILEDYFPHVEVRLPEDGAEIPEIMAVPLVVVANDDYGISRANLRFRIYNEMISADSVGEDEFNTIPLQGTSDQSASFIVQSIWSLADFPLIPSEEVHYFVEVWDNDGWNGAKRARSELRRLVFPSMEDLFTRTEETETQTVEELNDVLKDAETIREKVEQTLERLKSNPEELSWEESQAMQQTLEKQENLVKQMEEIAESLKNLEKSFVEHNMVNEELLTKYRELQELMEEIATPEMRQAMDKIREAIENQDGEQLRNALEQFTMDQEKFLENLDRSLSILKQLQAERRMEELVNRAKDLAERQEELTDRLNSDQPQDLDHEALRQDQIKKNFDDLMKDMKKASDELSEQFPELADSLANLEKQMSEDQLSQQLSETSQELKSGQRSEASESSRKNQQQLDQLAQQLSAMQMQMIQQSKDAITAEMDKIMEQLLSISRYQENLRNESSQLGTASPRYRQLAARQKNMIEALSVAYESAMELTKQTFFVGVQLLSELGNAGSAMERSLGKYTDRRPRDVSGEQTNAIAAIHRGLRQLSQAQQSMQQSSSSSGYQEMMDQLSQMAAQQQSLNQASQGMPMPMPGQSPGGQNLSELAAQQRAMAEAMRQLEHDAQRMENVLGNLDGLGDAMESVAKDLEDMNISDRTKRLQKRILQRLLDSLKSLQEREKSRERLSQTGEDIRRLSPSDIYSMHENMLREKMLKALEDDFQTPWKTVIRDYFRALEKVQVENE